MLNLSSELDQARRAVEDARWEITHHEIGMSEAIAQNRADAMNRHEALLSIWRERLDARMEMYAGLLRAAVR